MSKKELKKKNTAKQCLEIIHGVFNSLGVILRTIYCGDKKSLEEGNSVVFS